MKRIYLFLAIIGAIIPYIFYFQFIQVEGLNFSIFITELFDSKLQVVLRQTYYWLLLRFGYLFSNELKTQRLPNLLYSSF